MLPNHSILSFVMAKNSSSNALMTVRKDVDDETYQIVADFLDENFKRNGKNSQWLVKVDEAKEVCYQVDDILEQLAKDEKESDDELIQETLSRRFKSQSSGKYITEENVEDSTDECAISFARRLRHIYKLIHEQQATIKELSYRVHELENKSARF
jgi:hypothetical protein